MRTRIVITLSALILCTMAVALLARSVLDRPAGFALEQYVNHQSRHGEGLSASLAAWVMERGIVRDWANGPAEPLPSAPFPLLLSAANPDLSYPYQTYTASGRPDELGPGAFAPPAGTRRVHVDSVEQLLAALANAAAGDIITPAPGHYHIAAHAVPLVIPGSPDRPVYLRAEQFGQVLITMQSLEGFLVAAPFWVMENLRIHGGCEDHRACEHALHVVGQGRSFTLRNSELVDFNAAIKVNARNEAGKTLYPDHGLIEYNSLYNTSHRNTDGPVTVININAVDDWVVRGNYIADFAKRSGDQISYGAFMKGNGSNGLFERNLVLCEHRLPPDEGARLGLSFGGGGTGSQFCRHGRCDVEFTAGTLRGNVIMHCSRDVGVYLNRAADSHVYHNLLYNNLGIDVRYAGSSATISHNIVSGRIAEREHGHWTGIDNLVATDCIGAAREHCSLSDIYLAPDQADFRLRSIDSPVSRPTREPVLIDRGFCGEPTGAAPGIGPFQSEAPPDCLAGSTTVD